MWQHSVVLLLFLCVCFSLVRFLLILDTLHWFPYYFLLTKLFLVGIIRIARCLTSTLIFSACPLFSV